MPNFKAFINGLLILPMAGCLDLSKEQFFSSTTLNKQSKEVEYQDIHQLNLAISELVKEVDESGFSPKLKSQFTLHNLNGGAWPQAWVAFNISVHLRDKELARISKANVMQDHSLMVSFEQHLPKFGISQEELTIRVTPVAWMPTFPLHILPVTNSSESVQTPAVKGAKNKVSALP